MIDIEREAKQIAEAKSAACQMLLDQVAPMKSGETLPEVEGRIEQDEPANQSVPILTTQRNSPHQVRQ